MVVGPLGLLISMIHFTYSLVGCYTVCTKHGETGQAGQAVDREHIKTGERERRGCWASWAFDQCDVFHMFFGWMLHGVHIVHSEVSIGLGEGHRVEGRREHCEESAEIKAHGAGSRVRGLGSGEKKRALRALGMMTPVKQERKENGWYTHTLMYVCSKGAAECGRPAQRDPG